MIQFSFVLISVVRSRNNVVNNYTGRRGGPDYPDSGPPDVLSTILGITSFCVILTIFVYRPPPFSFRSNLLFQWPSSRNLSPVMVCLCPPNIRSSIFFILFILLLLVCLYSSFLLLFFLCCSLLFFYFVVFLPFLFFVILLYSFSFFLFSTAIFRCVHKIAKSGYQFRHVCPSVHVVQLGSHLTDFHEI